ncbi:MAG: ABC transporter permease [Lachnospiraceae bacterium]|jgi:ribose/xylose/arabinose/galactoside ABC-type transport system permease subunit|nr:ABC transporter permease [Lachnospiraceae bacterium]
MNTKTKPTPSYLLASARQALGRFHTSPAFAGSMLFLAALVLNAALQGPASFFTVKNINTLFTKNTPFMLAAIAQSLLLMTGTMDISCGVQMALVNVVVIMTGQEWGIPFPLSCLLGIGAAILASLLCWVCCSVLRLPALLASYALTFVIKGVNVMIMSVPQGKVEKLYYKAYDSQIFGFIPASILGLALVLLIWAYVRRTRLGTHMYAVGGNQRDAFAAGISPMGVQLKAFLLKGFIIGAAGVCLTLMTAAGNPLQAEDYGIRSLSACIIGGLSFGGWGTVGCAISGAGFLVLIQNSVYYFFSMLVKMIPGFSVTSYYQNFASDLLILLGLLMTMVTARGQREALRRDIVRQLKTGIGLRDQAGTPPPDGAAAGAALAPPPGNGTGPENTDAPAFDTLSAPAVSTSAARTGLSDGAGVGAAHTKEGMDDER